MKRTTIMADEDLLLELEQIAADQGVSTSQVIREALAAYVVETKTRQAAARALPSFVGIGEGPVDLSERHEELLDELTDPQQGWE